MSSICEGWSPARDLSAMMRLKAEPVSIGELVAGLLPKGEDG